METGVAGSTLGGGGVSTAWAVYGLQVAEQVQSSGDQGSSVGATTGPLVTRTDSDPRWRNGHSRQDGCDAQTAKPERETTTTTTTTTIMPTRIYSMENTMPKHLRSL
jgi:hypothetical protein